MGLVGKAHGALIQRGPLRRSARRTQQKVDKYSTKNNFWHSRLCHFIFLGSVHDICPYLAGDLDNYDRLPALHHQRVRIDQA